MKQSLIGLALSSVLLTVGGCGGGGSSDGTTAGSGSSSPPPPPPPPPASEFVDASEYCPTLAGRVFDIAGIGQSAIVEQVEFIAATGATDDAAADSCRIIGFIPDLTTESGGIRFQITMPDDWNLNLLFIGGGGFGGEIATDSASGAKLELGYAMVSTDMGHTGNAFDASWALDYEEGVANYLFAAIPKVLEAAKAIIAVRYEHYVVYDSLDGTPLSGLARTLFEGCSGGGREALFAAQRAPQLFDGIVARAPSLGGAFAAFNRNAKLVAAAPLSTGKLETLDRAELAACDELDGLVDDIIGRPHQCDFDPAALLCDAAEGDDCLTGDELATVTGIRAPAPLGYNQVDGLTSYPGSLAGHVADFFAWPIWIMRGAPPVFPQPLQFATQEGALRYLVAKDPDLNSLSVSAADYPAEFAALSAAMDATAPDLSAFAERGGKLILWHGLADAALSAESTRLYYQALLDFHAAHPDTPDPRDFVALYLAPGVFHCGRGPGADRADLVAALEDWLWNSESAPQPLVAERRHPDTGTLELSRPLCRYPQYARYDGAGDPSAADSFVCTDPE